MIELATVMVIIGVVAAIAVPRFAAGAERSKRAALKANLRVLNNAIDLYRVEHRGVSPARQADGVTVTSEKELLQRLLERTDENGDSGVLFGPYLLKIPVNPYNGLDTVRIDGGAAGDNSAGWRYSTVRESFQADDSVLNAAMSAGDASHLATGDAVLDAAAKTVAAEEGGK